MANLIISRDTGKHSHIFSPYDARHSKIIIYGTVNYSEMVRSETFSA